MNYEIALIGATGNVGSRILTELLNRGHEVTGIARHPEKLLPRANLTAKCGGANDEEGLAGLLSGHNAVISAGRFVSVNPRTLIAALKKAEVRRLLVVGGAGSLEVAPAAHHCCYPEAGQDFYARLGSSRPNHDQVFFVSGVRKS